MLVLGFGAPNLAQAMFHDHIENLGGSITDLFNKPDLIYDNPVNEGQRIINELYSKYPNIEQEDVNVAYYGIVNECIKGVDKSGNPYTTLACQITTHDKLTEFMSDWNYNYVLNTAKTMPPQLGPQHHLTNNRY